ncbi:MAG: glycosyltransferase [Flavicella sp.]
MKIAIVTAFPPSKITLNEYAYYLVKYFRQKAEISEIIILADTNKSHESPNFGTFGCKVSIVKSWSFNSYWNLFSVFKQVHKHKPDVVLFNLQFLKFGNKKIPAALGLFLPWLCKNKYRKSVVLLHNLIEFVDLKYTGFANNSFLDNIYRLIGTFLTRCLLASDLLVVTIDKYVDVLKKKYNKENITMIPHGSFETLEAPESSRSSKIFKLLTFGKFGTYKKVEILIEAIKKINKANSNPVELVIAGTDNPNTPGYLASVAEKYKEVSNIVFTGYVPEEKVASYFKESSLVVFPYTSTTGSSGVLHQAGSYGRAMVMPKIGDLSLLIQSEGYQACFYKLDDVNSLITAISKVMNNHYYRVQQEQHNFKVASSFSMDKITDRYLQEFENLNKLDKTFSKRQFLKTYLF